MLTKVKMLLSATAAWGTQRDWAPFTGSPHNPNIGRKPDLLTLGLLVALMGRQAGSSPANSPSALGTKKNRPRFYAPSVHSSAQMQWHCSLERLREQRLTPHIQSMKESSSWCVPTVKCKKHCLWPNLILGHPALPISSHCFSKCTVQRTTFWGESSWGRGL